ncbi:murein biosynthesis integral membrane protein MurJ [Arthrobacter sp. EH-1B-1]|uniref:Probable lipid II flippase MurJ n=1 Tax=Arthrobacter vasquezii TaxID=2977629 RepID=A0ABT6CST7_9MICC|nr:murein biosynthesis integral membrane protein MurJ [Arthrobacter vasquezii]MDF9276965.1 murein biosynthesis integral membrane protein MurJ [Arthrobacter vasquezii]
MARLGGKSISRAAVLVAGLTAVSTLLGFLRDVVIAAIFGAGAELDAYLVAQGLMNIVLGLVAYAMARSATPVVSREAAVEDGNCRGHTGFDVAFTLTMVVLGIGGVVMAIFAGPVASLLAPGFDAETTATAATLTRIVLVATVLVAGTDLLAALAQSHGRFAWASLQGVPFNLIMIAAAGLFGPRYGIAALAVGFVVGSGARLLLQLPPLRSLGTRVRPRLQLKDPGFREIAVLVPAMLVGSAVGNVNTLVDRAVGSTLEEGAITALSYGWRLVNLPEQLLIASLLVPLYPAISASVRDLTELRRLVNRGLSVTVTILVPLCVVLAVAAEPLVEVAFGRGAFSPEDIEATATAVLWYAPALLALGIRQVVVSTAYALGDARAPVVISVLAMVVNVVGDILLAPVMGVAGIALATSASLVLAAVANAWLLRSRHDGVNLREAFVLLLRAALLAAVAGAVGVVLASLVAGPALMTSVVVVFGVCGTYALGLVVLRAPEGRVPLDMLRAARRR